MLRMLTSALLLGCMAMPALAAQKCDSAKEATAPASRFKAGDNGTVTDSQTGHVWLRCPVGMSWNGSSCEGQSLTYNWYSANSVIDDLNDKQAGGHSNWRLPTVAELQSIVEYQCFKPAVNLDVFPYTPESGFWTATEADGVSNPRAMIVHFINGREYVANKRQSWRVRPVADK